MPERPVARTTRDANRALAQRYKAERDRLREAARHVVWEHDGGGITDGSLALLRELSGADAHNSGPEVRDS